MDQGELVPDVVMIGIVEERLRRPDTAAGFVLDGFPRTLPQAAALGEMLGRLGGRLDRAVDFQVSSETLVRRVGGRAELDGLAESFIRDHGGVPSFKHYRGYPASICVSIDDEVVHGIPGTRRLREGSIVSVDLGVYLDGGHGDVARTVPVGEVDEETRRLLQVTAEALEAGIREAREGRTTGGLGWALPPGGG